VGYERRNQAAQIVSALEDNGAPEADAIKACYICGFIDFELVLEMYGYLRFKPVYVECPQ
jgi:hypothetical protein